MEFKDPFAGSDVFLGSSFFDNEQFGTGVLDTRAHTDWGLGPENGMDIYTYADYHHESVTDDSHDATKFGNREVSTADPIDFSCNAMTVEDNEWSRLLNEPLVNGEDDVSHEVPSWQPDFDFDDIFANEASDFSLTPQENSSHTVRPVATCSTSVFCENVLEPKPSWPSKADWEDQREAITKLYSVEGKSLREVMTIMAQIHGHKGTVKMFKTRITKWNLDKKNKADDMAFVLRKRTQLQQQGIGIIFKIRGKLLHDEDITKYAKRKLRQDPTFLSGYSDTSTPPHIEYHSPCSCSNSRTIGAILMQGELKCKNCMKSHILQRLRQDHLSGAVQNLLPTYSPHLRSKASSTTQQVSRSQNSASVLSKYIIFSMRKETWALCSPSQPSNTVLSTFKSVSQMLCSKLIAASCQISDSTNINEVGQLLYKALHTLAEMTEEQHPMLLHEVLCAALLLLRNGLQQVALMVLDFVHNASLKSLGLEHPWCLISKVLTEERDDVEICLAELYCCAADCFAKYIGLQSFLAVRYKAGYAYDVLRINSPDSAVTQLSALRRECMAPTRPADDAYFLVTEHLANVLLDRGQLRHTLALGQEWLQHAESAKRGQESIRALELLADVQMKASTSTACYAEQNLRRAAEMTADKFGRDDPCYMRLIHKLAKWYSMWGQEEEAEVMMVKLGESFIAFQEQTYGVCETRETRLRSSEPEEPAISHVTKWTAIG